MSFTVVGCKKNHHYYLRLLVFTILCVTSFGFTKYVGRVHHVVPTISSKSHYGHTSNNQGKRTTHERQRRQRQRRQISFFRIYEKKNDGDDDTTNNLEKENEIATTTTTTTTTARREEESKPQTEKVVDDDNTAAAATIDELLDRQFFNPDDYDDDDQSIAGRFANLVKSDYALAETVYVGIIFAVMVIFSQELLRMQLYGDNYVPFSRGVLPGRLF